MQLEFTSERNAAGDRIADLTGDEIVGWGLTRGSLVEVVMRIGYVTNPAREIPGAVRGLDAEIDIAEPITRTKPYFRRICGRVETGFENCVAAEIGKQVLSVGRRQRLVVFAANRTRPGGDAGDRVVWSDCRPSMGRQARPGRAPKDWIRHRRYHKHLKRTGSALGSPGPVNRFQSHANGLLGYRRYR